MGIAAIVVWIAFWSLLVLILAVLGLFAVRRADQFSALPVVVVTPGIVSAIVFFQFWSGFSLSMSIAVWIPPFAGGISLVGYLQAVTGRRVLIPAIFLTMAPRRLQTVVPA